MAEALGHALTEENDLHLLVDGATLRPEAVDGDTIWFRLPRHAGQVRLRSRAWVPAQMSGSGDDRRLGVLLRRILLGNRPQPLDSRAGTCQRWTRDGHSAGPTAMRSCRPDRNSSH